MDTKVVLSLRWGSYHFVGFVTVWPISRGSNGFVQDDDRTSALCTKNYSVIFKSFRSDICFYVSIYFKYKEVWGFKNG